jgi:hypothetical protein
LKYVNIDVDYANTFSKIDGSLETEPAALTLEWDAKIISTANACDLV